MRAPPKNVIAVFNTTCNYRCRFCSQGLPDKIMRCWSYEDIVTRLDSLWDTSEIYNIGGCGEITALPFFEKLMDYLDGKPGQTCFATNGYRLIPRTLRRRRLDHIVISLHSLDPKVYDNLTGTTGRLSTVLENIKQMSVQPRGYRVVVASVVTGLNVLESPALARFVLDVGADELRFLPLTDPGIAGIGQYDDDLILQETPENQAAVRDANNMMTAGGAESIYTILTPSERRQTVTENMYKCLSPTHQILIGPDGHVQPCCFIPEQYAMGNIFQEPWEEIWNSDAYEQFRRQVKSNSCNPCLRYCKNWG